VEHGMTPSRQPIPLLRSSEPVENHVFYPRFGATHHFEKFGMMRLCAYAFWPVSGLTHNG
jgi:hypothetical protein